MRSPLTLKTARLQNEQMNEWTRPFSLSRGDASSFSLEEAETYGRTLRRTRARIFTDQIHFAPSCMEDLAAERARASSLSFKSRSGEREHVRSAGLKETLLYLYLTITRAKWPPRQRSGSQGRPPTLLQWFRLHSRLRHLRPRAFHRERSSRNREIERQKLSAEAV